MSLHQQEEIFEVCSRLSLGAKRDLGRTARDVLEDCRGIPAVGRHPCPHVFLDDWREHAQDGSGQPASSPQFSLLPWTALHRQ